MAMKTPNKVLDKLWVEYNKSKNLDAREELVKAYLPVIERIAQQLHNRIYPKSVSQQDLLNAGALGLCQSLEAFDPDKKVLFRTFCQLRISGAMIDLLRDWDWLPRSARKREIELRKVWKGLKEKLKRPPTTLEMAQAFNMSLEAFKQYRYDYSVGYIYSMGDCPASEDVSYGHVEDIDHEAIDFNMEGVDVVWEQMKETIMPVLSFKERGIIDDYYFKGKSLKCIAAEHGLTESAISVTHTAILTKLAKVLEPNMLF